MARLTARLKVGPLNALWCVMCEPNVQRALSSIMCEKVRALQYSCLLGYIYNIYTYICCWRIAHHPWGNRAARFIIPTISQIHISELTHKKNPLRFYGVWFAGVLRSRLRLIAILSLTMHSSYPIYVICERILTYVIIICNWIENISYSEYWGKYYNTLSVYVNSLSVSCWCLATSNVETPL